MDIFILISFIPSILLLYFYVHKEDTLEKKPKLWLFILFCIGVLIIFPITFIKGFFINPTPSFTKALMITQIGFNQTTTGIIDDLIMSYAIVAFIEEGYKYIILYLLIWKNKKFNHIYHGIVYSVFLSLGFIAIDNYLYFYLNNAEVDILRIIITALAHMFFAVVSGFYLGLAKEREKLGQENAKVKFIVLSILSPIFLHGTFYFLILTCNNPIVWMLFGIIAIYNILSFTEDIVKK